MNLIGLCGFDFLSLNKAADYLEKRGYTINRIEGFDPHDDEDQKTAVIGRPGDTSPTSVRAYGGYVIGLMGDAKDTPLFWSWSDLVDASIHSPEITESMEMVISCAQEGIREVAV